MERAINENETVEIVDQASDENLDYVPPDLDEEEHNQSRDLSFIHDGYATPEDHEISIGSRGEGDRAENGFSLSWTN